MPAATARSPFLLAPQVRRAARALRPCTLALALAACADDGTSPRVPLRPGAGADLTGSALVQQVRQLAAGRGITALAAPAAVRPALSQLGQMLAFDPIMSGNRDIACMTCHHPKFATGDSRSLSIGAGGSGLGPARSIPGNAFIPRNAPALFNLHALTSLFWDGRVSGDRTSGYHTPAGAALTPDMTAIMEFGPVSAQPLFPLLSHAEMRGQPGPGNELAAIPDDSTREIWDAIMTRLRAVPGYKGLFEAAYPGVRFEDMNLAYASNAIAGFFLDRLTFNQTPWDRFLRGDDGALTGDQLVGARTFLSLKCSVCHNGPALTDNQFHNVAIAQLGPGEGDGAGGNDDFGRERVTGNPADRYAFRTTPLRNAELTFPYGHDGAIVDLTDFVRHYSQSDLKLASYDPFQLEPLLRPTVLNDAAQILATRDTLLNGVVLSDSIVIALRTYLGALTDPAARNLNALVPARVPSGLPPGGH